MLLVHAAFRIIKVPKRLEVGEPFVALHRKKHIYTVKSANSNHSLNAEKWLLYAVKAQTSLAPLSCLAGSRGLMRMHTNIVYFRVMRRLYRRKWNWLCVNLHPWQRIRDHGVWRLTLTGYWHMADIHRVIIFPGGFWVAAWSRWLLLTGGR